MDDPDIAGGVDEGADKEERDDEVAEREPVGSVSHEGEACVSLLQTLPNIQNPPGQPGITGGLLDIRDAEDCAKEVHFMQQWKCGDAAENQTEDEQADQEASFRNRVHESVSMFAGGNRTGWSS